MADEVSAAQAKPQLSALVAEVAYSGKRFIGGYILGTDTVLELGHA